MEEKQGLLSHFGGVIRIIIFIILIGVIVFFAARFFRNRQNTNKAREVSQNSQNKEGTSNQNAQGTKELTSSKDTPATEQPKNNNQSQLPSGIADVAQTPSAGPQAIPETGMSSNTFLLAGILGFAAYLMVLKTSAKH